MVDMMLFILTIHAFVVTMTLSPANMLICLWLICLNMIGIMYILMRFTKKLIAVCVIEVPGSM